MKVLYNSQGRSGSPGSPRTDRRPGIYECPFHTAESCALPQRAPEVRPRGATGDPPRCSVRRRRRWLGALLLALLAAPLPAQDPRQAELAEIRAEIRRLEARLAETRSREASLEGRLAGVKVELALQEAQLAEATAAFELAESQAAATEGKIAELEVALVELRADLRQRLGGLYRLGRQGYLRLFLSLDPDVELLPAIRQLRFLVRRDQHTLERYTATREELGTQREVLLARRQEMERWQQQEQERRDGLVRVRRRHERLLSQVSRERRRLAERSTTLQDKAQKLGRMIQALVGESSAPLAGTPIQEFRGALDWPIRGEVVGSFGPRRDPQYKTEVPHNGVDLRTEPGAQVRAVFPGEVLYSSQFEGYGPMVVVHHPGRAFTLYAGLAQLKPGKGDVLSLGDVVGTATETLYFEIRIENQPEDPLHWLR